MQTWPKFLRIALSATLIACGFALIGCGDKPGATNKDSKSGGSKRFILLTNGNSPYWDACRFGLQEGAKEFKLEEAGIAAVMEVNDGTPKGQIDKLRQFGSQSDILAVAVS